MPVQDLVGRRKEAAILEKYYASDKSEFVAVYGRRRVGKTYLVQKITTCAVELRLRRQYSSHADTCLPLGSKIDPLI